MCETWCIHVDIGRIVCRTTIPTSVTPPCLCCSVSQCVAVCCSALQCVAVRCRALQCVAVRCSVLQCVAVCCSYDLSSLHSLNTFCVESQERVRARDRLHMKYLAVCCSMLQCGAVCCSVLQ